MDLGIFVVPMDRLGVVSAQPDFTRALSSVNRILKSGGRVNWLIKEKSIKTDRFPEGYIFQAGAFLMPASRESELLLEEEGVLFQRSTLKLLPGRRIAGKSAAIYSGKGAAEFCTKPLAEALGWMGFDFRMVDDSDIRNGKLSSFDALIVPGGPDAGEGYYFGLGEKGYQEIRKFVRGKGDYLGICAGAYLPLTDKTGKNRFWMGLVEATDEQGLDYWRTGTGFVRVKVEDSAHPFAFGLAAGPLSTQDMVYWEGPAMIPTGESVRVLATYDAFVASGAQGDCPRWDLGDNGPAKDSINSWYNVLTRERFERHLKGKPAMMEAFGGGGRMLLYSPHVEFGNIGAGPRRTSQAFQFLSNALFYFGMR